MVHSPGEVDLLDQFEIGRGVNHPPDDRPLLVIKLVRTDFMVNALGTFNVLDAVRLYCPEAVFILASTNKVYGKIAGAATELDTARHAYVDVLWSYGLLHGDVETAAEYLRHADGFLRRCGSTPNRSRRRSRRPHSERLDLGSSD